MIYKSFEDVGNQTVQRLQSLRELDNIPSESHQSGVPTVLRFNFKTVPGSIWIISQKMAKFATFALVMVFGYLLSQSTALPTPDEDRYMDKEFNRELVNWLLTYQYPQHLGSICKYYESVLGGPMSKRNSELINSLLSLPKNMNDAGK